MKNCWSDCARCRDHPNETGWIDENGQHWDVHPPDPDPEDPDPLHRITQVLHLISPDITRWNHSEWLSDAETTAAMNAIHRFSERDNE
ncbi:MAG: hypothetical protein GY906_24550 [bacterium]|nr:hypothetical protein [bacterium]